MPQRAGWEFQIDVNGVAFVAKRYQIKAESPLLDCSNSEGKPGKPGGALAPGFAGSLRNLRRATVSVGVATYDDDVNYFAPPLSLREANYLSNVKVYPGGRSGARIHSIDSLLITAVTLEGTVGQEQPVSFEGVSDGNYNLT
jgi:hypothetical protein